MSRNSTIILYFFFLFFLLLFVLKFCLIVYKNLAEVPVENQRAVSTLVTVTFIVIDLTQFNDIARVGT
jgi:hypothetical protein